MIPIAKQTVTGIIGSYRNRRSILVCWAERFDTVGPLARKDGTTVYQFVEAELTGSKSQNFGDSYWCAIRWKSPVENPKLSIATEY